MSKYIINKHKLASIINGFKQSASIYYPVKVNSSIEIVRIIDSYIDGYEVDSIELLEFLLNDCAVSPDRILYSALISDKSDYQKVLLLGIRTFVVDDYDLCDLLCSLGKEEKLSLIIRLDISDLVHCNGYIVKWGCALADLQRVLNIIEETNNAFLGLSFYVPQELNVINNALMIVDKISGLDIASKCRIVDVGGGMSVDETERVIASLRSKSSLSDSKIIIEPGRYLLDPCIDMRCEIKRISIKKDYKLVFLDTGIYNGLLDCVMKNKRFEIVPVDNYENCNCSSYIVCGNTSDISDVLGEYVLPDTIKVGTQLLIKNVGAYCREMETNFYRKENNNEIVME